MMGTLARARVSRVLLALGTAGHLASGGGASAARAETFPLNLASASTEARARWTLAADLQPVPDVDVPNLGDLPVSEPGQVRLPGRVLEDLRALVRAPRDWGTHEWTKLGLAAAAVALVGRYDEPIHEFADRQRTPETTRIAQTLRPLGQEGGIALLAGTWIAGRAFHRPRWVAIAQDGLEASLIASGLITPTLKAITGRSRPRSTDEVSAFRSGGESFPSGEATQAFALAAVVAGYSDSRWVKGAAYGVAGLLGAQRIALDAHWASDVVAGALVGASVGQWLVRRHRPGDGEESADRPSWALSPTGGPSGRGFGLVLRATF